MYGSFGLLVSPSLDSERDLALFCRDSRLLDSVDLYPLPPNLDFILGVLGSRG